MQTAKLGLQPQFEAQLNDCWQRRDFSAWQDARMIYADWLEEQWHVLWRMARCPVRMRSHNNFGHERYMWTLLFDLPRSDAYGEEFGKPRPRWWRNRRFNAEQILGFPPYTMRCTGWENETHTARFTVRFVPAPPMRRISNARYGLAGVTEVPLALDTKVHADGFPAMFWTKGVGVVHEVTPRDVLRQQQQMELWK